MDTIDQLLQRGQQAETGGVSQALLSASEAERIISQLSPLGLEDVGSAKWHMQHEWIERLNLQAHYNAQTHSDEFVVELLVSLDKLQVLVHDLLLIEAWKEFVYPLLASHLAEQVDSVSTYLLLYHEVTVANLLQVALYHSHAAESLTEDYALEVADWCYRKLTKLNAEGHRLAEHKERSAEELLQMSRLEEQEEKRREVEFSVMMCSLAILRYVTDALPKMPMGALSRVVATNDTLMGLLPLLDRPPWVRTRVPPGGNGRPVLEKWAGNRWAPVPPADRLKITQTDGQVWLAVTNLLVEPRCRAKYSLDEFRRERILGLKRHLNELMFDQLPVLKDLQRVLDELALGVLPDQSGGKGAALILEAVPVVRDAMLRGRNWRALAERAKQEHFGAAAAGLARERMEALVKHLDFLCELEPEPAAAASGPGKDGGSGATGAAAPEPHPPVKVSTWRKVHDSGVYESWYDFSMEVDDSRPPEPVEVAAPAAGTSSGSGGEAVHGLRYRLRPMDVDGTRPLPANGKAVVRWGSLSAEALLQLPELPTRGSEEGAAVLWVTVGLLAVDGLVLQVKLKKAAKPKERDRVAGVWYAYHPVAGALTVLREEAQPAAAKPQASSRGADSIKGAGEKGAAAGKASARPLVQVLSETAAPAGTAGSAGEGSGAAGKSGRGPASGENGAVAAAAPRPPPPPLLSRETSGQGAGVAGGGQAAGPTPAIASAPAAAASKEQEAPLSGAATPPESVTVTRAAPAESSGSVAAQFVTATQREESPAAVAASELKPTAAAPPAEVALRASGDVGGVPAVQPAAVATSTVEEDYGGGLDDLE